MDFSKRAEDAVIYSQEEALRFGSDCIDIEHLLLGLLRSDGMAIIALNELQIDLKMVHQEIEKKILLNTNVGSHNLADIPITKTTKQAECVLQRAILEAMLQKVRIEKSMLPKKVELDENFKIGSEHLLLAILGEDNVAQNILNKQGVFKTDLLDFFDFHLKQKMPTN